MFVIFRKPPNTLEGDKPTEFWDVLDRSLDVQNDSSHQIRPSDSLGLDYSRVSIENMILTMINNNLPNVQQRNESIQREAQHIPSNFKTKRSIYQGTVYIDPLFGIPVVNHSMQNQLNIFSSKGRTIERGSQPTKSFHTKSRPFAPAANHLQRRCRSLTSGCSGTEFDHPCCQYQETPTTIERFFPIEPYVESSILVCSWDEIYQELQSQFSVVTEF